ncbi:MAG: acetylxylan esterase [Kiritimatiellae bacterium]|nr:acetylxylan esterase [Kiritimatiellia bacterium]MDD5521157.1 acetylxylan esterase [Kiritimatiellia bacterium]
MRNKNSRLDVHRRLLSIIAFIAVTLTLIVPWTLLAQQTAAPVKPNYAFTMAVDRVDARYNVGEKVIFNAELKVDGQPAQDVKLPYVIREDDYTTVTNGEMVFTAGKASITATFRKPSFLLAVVTMTETEPVKKTINRYAGAACKPEKIAPSMPKPDDFDTFWGGKKNEMDNLPFHAELKPITGQTDDKIEVYEMILNSINGAKVYGYFAKPKGVGPFPAYMEVHGAGVYSLSPNSVVSYAKRGVMAIDMNAHELESGKPKEYYDALKEGSLKDYPHQGCESRDTCYFLRMFCSCYRTAQYITSRIEWDRKHFVVYGSSQGGGQAFVTAGLCPKVTAFVSNVPALCDHTGPEAGRSAGWPRLVAYTGGKADPKQLQASRYFDCVNFAYAIKAKALVSAGFIDVTCAPSSVYAACNVLSGPKRVFDTVRYGHTSAPEFTKEIQPFIHDELGLAGDMRLGALKDLNGYFPFIPPPTREAWTKRSERVKRQLLVTLGLWPMPAKTPLNAVIHGKIDRGDYTVEKVFFESVPGFFVTGSLYRPKGKNGPLPGVLYPHGHWAQGRFDDSGVNGVRKEIVQGAERFEEGGRSPLQSICVQMARMGCVVFHYDMIGYADSLQIPREISHGFSKQRPDMNTIANWGLFSPQAETHYQSVMGLQTLNSIRSVDFLLSLPDVDPKRIAVTGASGGGTQTMILAAVDPRIAFSFPAVMVSTAMQGGCTCENASGVRVDTGNIEFSALFAPKPQGMNSANDWTKEMWTKGFPEIKQIYAMLGAADKVMLQRGEHFQHNYNYVTREAFYQLLNRYFKLGLPEPVIEEDYKRLTKEEMTVWDAAHPAPPSGPDFERKLLKDMLDDANRKLNEAVNSAAEFRNVYGGAVDIVIGRNLEDTGEIKWTPSPVKNACDYVVTTGILRNHTHCEELPVVIIEPKSFNGQTVIWIDPIGKAGLFTKAPDGKEECNPKPEIKHLLDSGARVIGVDLLYQGDFLVDGKSMDKTRRVNNPREAPAYTFGYNHALFAQRVHDILTVVAFARSRDPKPKSIALTGLKGAGPWVAAARAQCGDAVERTAIDTGGFRFGSILDMHDINFIPGGAKFGDLPGMIALAAPGKLWLAGEATAGQTFVRKQYTQVNAEKALTIFSGTPENESSDAIGFLLSN